MCAPCSIHAPIMHSILCTHKPTSKTHTCESIGWTHQLQQCHSVDPRGQQGPWHIERHLGALLWPIPPKVEVVDKRNALSPPVQGQVGVGGVPIQTLACGVHPKFKLHKRGCLGLLLLSPSSFFLLLCNSGGRVGGKWCVRYGFAPGIPWQGWETLFQV